MWFVDCSWMLVWDLRFTITTLSWGFTFGVRWLFPGYLTLGLAITAGKPPTIFHASHAQQIFHVFNGVPHTNISLVTGILCNTDWVAATTHISHYDTLLGMTPFQRQCSNNFPYPWQLPWFQCQCMFTHLHCMLNCLWSFTAILVWSSRENIRCMVLSSRTSQRWLVQMPKFLEKTPRRGPIYTLRISHWSNFLYWLCLCQNKDTAWVIFSLNPEIDLVTCGM